MGGPLLCLDSDKELAVRLQRVEYEATSPILPFGRTPQVFQLFNCSAAFKSLCPMLFILFNSSTFQLL